MSNDSLSPEYEAELRRMIASTNVTETMKTQLQMMVAQIASVDPESEEIMTAVCDRLDTSVLIDRLMPVYARHYSHEMATAVADFYESEIGRQFIEAQPAIMRDIMPISNEWIMSATHEILMGMMMGPSSEDSLLN